ncbi:hypothetical protein AB5I83_04880 [Mesobacillus sp. LC4]
MTKLDTFKLLNLIENVYPLVTLKSDTVQRWMASCELMDYSLVFKKLALHIRENPYPPSLEDILVNSGANGSYFDWLDEYSIRTENGAA